MHLLPFLPPGVGTVSLSVAHVDGAIIANVFPPVQSLASIPPPMARSYRFDVRGLLLQARTAGAKGNVSEGGPSQLSIVLHPAVPYVQQQAAAYPYPLPSNTVCMHRNSMPTLTRHPNAY